MTLLRADAEMARRQAAAILHESRFHNPSVPRPLHSLLHDLGSGLQSLGRAITGLAQDLGSVLPGGVVTAWTLLALLVVGLVALVARRYTASALTGASAARSGVAGRLHDAGALEREAQRAEQEGRFEDAVRLRFRAGLDRLSERGVISPARFTPTRDVSQALRSPGFQALARRFDEVAYGADPADASDARAARDGWAQILSGAREL